MYGVLHENYYKEQGIMTYDEFLCYVKEGMEDILGENYIVRIHKVLKNNDVELDALTVLSKDSNVSPTIYLNPYYEEYKSGVRREEILRDIYQLYDGHSRKINFNVDVFRDFELIREKIAFKLINTDANKKLLKDVPNVPFMDLSMVFYCILDDENFGNATALIHNVHMDMWGITLEKLTNYAKINTPRLLQYELKDINDVIKEMLVENLNETVMESDLRYDENCGKFDANVVAEGMLNNISDLKSAIAMYVLTNKQKNNGAACMVYENVMAEFAKKVNSDVYIIPSSVHEVILVPAVEGIEKSELTEMVKEVNQAELDKIDVLSDHVYLYSKEEDKFSM